MTSYKIHTLAVRVAKLVSRLLSTNLVCDILLHKQMSDQVFPCTSLYLSNHKHLSRLSHHYHIQVDFASRNVQDILFLRENYIASPRASGKETKNIILNRKCKLLLWEIDCQSKKTQMCSINNHFD